MKKNMTRFAAMIAVLGSIVILGAAGCSQNPKSTTDKKADLTAQLTSPAPKQTPEHLQRAMNGMRQDQERAAERRAKAAAMPPTPTPSGVPQ